MCDVAGLGIVADNGRPVYDRDVLICEFWECGPGIAGKEMVGDELIQGFDIDE